MVKHRFIACILAAALILGLPGCGELAEESASSSPAAGSETADPAEEPAPAPFTLAFYPDYSIHPVLGESRANLVLSPLLYEGLFSLDERFQAVPALCERYTADEDGLAWTFWLKAGVTFSDGTPLTGSIAAQALNTALTSGTRYTGRSAGLRSITGDETTVTIRLNSPNAALPTLLDIPIALNESNRSPGTGPYVLTEADDSASLIARADWHGNRKLPFDAIRLFPIRQADDLIASFGSGEVTLLDADLTATNALGYSGSYEAWDYPTTDFVFLGFRCDKGFCRDANIRQAIARAVDRDAIVTVSYAGHAKSTALPVHPDSPLYDAGLAARSDYAPQTLAELLPQAALPSAPLVLLVNSENNTKISAAQSIAEQLQGLGLPIMVEKLPWNEYLSALTAGNFDLYLGEVLLTADFDLSQLISSAGTLNYHRFVNQDAARLLEGFRQGETALLYEFLRENMPFVPICFKNGSVLTQWGRLAGLAPRQNNIFNALENWSLDSERATGAIDRTEETQ